MDKKEKTNPSNVRKFFELIMHDFWVVLLDIIAANLSYYVALLIRFYVNGEFRSTVVYYQHYFLRFAPIYTILVIITFAAFKLYGGMWRYAGLNDMNRIIMANVVTTVLQIVGSIVVIAFIPDSRRSRMPISYYVIGAILQMGFVVLIRFSYKFFEVEKRKIASRKVETIPALVVGSDALGRKVIGHLEQNTVFRAVAVVGRDGGKLMNGVPVITIDEMSQYIQSQKIKAVFIADRNLSAEERDRVREAAQGLEVDDFTGYMSNQHGFLPVTNLLEVIAMPVLVVVDGHEQKFDSAEECLSALPGEYDVLKVEVNKLVLKKREEDKHWMEAYQEQTGMDVSFF